MTSSLLPKRAFDVAVSASGLLLLAPIGLLVSVLLRLSPDGRVLHRSPRLGRDRRAQAPTPLGPGSGRVHDAGGRPFERLRFRVLGSKLRSRGRRLGEHPQLTALGRVLRRSGFERWPELWCVLRGDMSLVGPRPSTLDFQHCLREHCPGWSDALGRLRPGIWEPRASSSSGSRSLMARLLEDRLQADEYLRTLSSAGVIGTLAFDLRSVIRGLSGGSTPVAGNDCVRIDYPHRFTRLPLDVAALCRSTPDEQGAEVHGTAQGFTAWWYPPRRPESALCLPRRDQVLSSLASSWSEDPGDGLRAEVSLASLPGSGEDRLRVDMPAGLQDLHHLADHFLPVFEALGKLEDDERLPTRLGMLLLELCCSEPASAEERRIVELLVDERGVRLSVNGGPSQALTPPEESSSDARLLASVNVTARSV